VGARARNMMNNADALEERVQGLILSCPICLNGSYFAIKLAFNKILKIMKA
jgi:hypothetical protein